MNPTPVFSIPPLKASDFIGTDVVNPHGDNLGTIKEVMLDPNTGKIAYGVVSFGGFLGLGEKLFAIPFKAFKYNYLKNEYMLNVPKERLEVAPGFDSEHWPTMADEQWNRDINQYYEVAPYWE